MHELSVREIRSAIGKLDKLVGERGELIVTRHGKPIARILPICHATSRPSHADLRKRMALLKNSSASLISEERDER